MILGIDIGNTNTVLGIYSEEAAVPARIFRYRTEKNITSDELGLLILKFLDFLNESNSEEGISGKVQGIAFSSVVPEVNGRYASMARDFFGLESLEINYKNKLSISIRYDNPEQLGADRIVNAEAAYREHGGGTIVVDIGTAATFCLVLEDGTFDGGLIAPGIGTTIKALAASASRLPRIDFEKPNRLVARDSVNAIKSGFFYGWLSMVEGIISKIERQYNQEFTVLLTGGFSQIIGENIERKNITDPVLTMKGIKYIHDINRRNV
ncbi:MAG: type III pantothenate kinase [bacterium]|nr:type III pantothenate kinase [bacterium]